MAPEDRRPSADATSGPRRNAAPNASGGPVLVVVLLLATMVALAVSMEVATYNIWGAFWVGPALIVLTLPVANRVARRHADPSLGRLIMIAAIAKVIGGAALRYWVDFQLYDISDAVRYHDAGSQLAPALRMADYSDAGRITGTRFTELLTGQVYALIGPSRLGGFMVFSWFAFVGLYLFWRAFVIAVPTGDARRYALLIFFFPTILLWTSGTGKDAWMILCLGLASRGFAGLLSGRASGAVIAGLGLWGAAVVRPHLALIFLVAALVSVPIRLIARRSAAAIGSRRGSNAVLLGTLALATVLTIGRAETVFNLEDLNVESAESVTERVDTDTAKKGSVFDNPTPSNPAGYGMALVTVLFRPFLFEVGNVQGLATAAEGIALVLLLVFSLRRLKRLPTMMLTTPYFLFAFAYTAAFIYAFASISNFGILARQRAQLLPVLFVLVCLQARNGHTPDSVAAKKHRADELTNV